MSETPLYEQTTLAADNVPYTATTESHITAKLTRLVMRTIQMQRSSLNQPLDHQIVIRADEAIEVPICVFERQRVRVDEILCYFQV